MTALDYECSPRLLAARAVEPPWASTQPITLLRRGTVVALRRAAVVAVGGLAAKTIVGGQRLVTASAGDGHATWIAAAAVWSDSDTDSRLQHPRAVGLATGTTWPVATLKGLSDRLGWEAVLQLEHRQLPGAPLKRPTPTSNIVVLDGRSNHDIPTVVVLGEDMIRWGAAATWDGAMRRALYGDDVEIDPCRELATVRTALADDHLDVATVDLGTPTLQAAGVVRCSVHLVTWDTAVRRSHAQHVN